MNHHLSSIGYFSFFWGNQFCINEFHQVFKQTVSRLWLLNNSPHGEFIPNSSFLSCDKIR